MREEKQAPAPSSLAGGEALDRFERAAFAKVQNLPRGTASRAEEIARRDAEYDAARNAILAALSPEAPAREVTGDMVEAACSRFVSESDEIWSASVWPEGPEDDGDRGDGGRVRLISESDQHNIRAAMRFALQDALTPRHEAPAETITSAELIANTDYARGAVRVPGETEDRRIYGQPEAPAEGWSCPANHDDYARMGHGACPYCRASLEGIRAAFIAPAEGAGEAAIAKLFDAVEMADDYNRLSDRPKRLAKDFLLDSELRDAVSSLRARSSAPEAREGEAVAWKFRNLDLRQVGVTMDRREADRKAEAGWEIEPLGLIVQPAAPSADKLRVVLEDAGRRLLHSAWAVGTAGSWNGKTRSDKAAEIAGWSREIDQALAALKAEG